MNLKRAGLLSILLVLLTANGFVWASVSLNRNHQLVVKVYDVGQGDSILIQTPDDYKILVDGGPNNRVDDYLNTDLALNDRSIDLLVLTHPQADHMTGLIEAIKRFQVKKVITSNVKNDSAQFKLWTDTLKNAHLTPEYVYAGESISLADQVTLKILWPDSPNPQVTNLNDAAVVMKLSYGNFDMLLTSDADVVTQPYTGTVNHVEVLKVPHHGSKTALKEDFLAKLQPDVSVISVGAHNSYGHPNNQLLELLNKDSKKVFRTDKNGTVTFVSNGTTWYTSVEK